MAHADAKKERAWYAKPSSRAKASVRASRKIAIRRRWVGYIKKKNGCADCGYNAHACALDFDHVRGEKLFNSARSLNCAPATIRAEIAKCDVVCSNCHCVRTQDRYRHERMG